MSYPDRQRLPGNQPVEKLICGDDGIDQARTDPGLCRSDDPTGHYRTVPEKGEQGFFVFSARRTRHAGGMKRELQVPAGK